jgi:ABC-2 type transport system ATP-binding protein
MAVIQLQSVCKSYGNQLVSDSISMNVQAGSIHGLLGQNGAGKTTLLRMMATITQPDQGQILFQCEPLRDSHSHQMGYMPEERGLYKRMSVVEQLLFFAEIRGLSRSQAKKEIRHWMERLGMTDWIQAGDQTGGLNRVKQSKKLEELSKGMAQKLQFLCTIIHRPKLLILDEPFSGFDPVNADLIRDVILDLKREGTAVVFSTHRMENIESLCDEISLIHQGRMEFQGGTQSVRRAQSKGQFELALQNDTNSASSPLRWLNHPHKTGLRQSPDGRWIFRFLCDDTFTPSQLLALAQAEGELIYFSEHLPSIHDIFVQTVQQAQHA